MGKPGMSSHFLIASYQFEIFIQNTTCGVPFLHCVRTKILGYNYNTHLLSFCIMAYKL